MPRPFRDYTDQFFWNFKRMDNVNYNFEILTLLYTAKTQNNSDRHFNKPIILTIMAIIECMLYDFDQRIRGFSTDAFPNITSSIVTYFRAMKETDELKVLLPRIKSQNLLRIKTGDTLYDDLEHLRQVRNRIHIQNKYAVLQRDEVNVFTNAEVNLAETCLEKVCEVLCNVYPRWNKQPLPMADFPRPWL
jgi:hypothetical protein